MEKLTSNQRCAYARFRRNGYRAEPAIRKARATAPDAREYGGESIWRRPIVNPIMSSGERWIENPTDIGLRFVGFADEVYKSNYNYSGGLNHTGWWTDEDGCGELARGVVYQIPARNGAPQFMGGMADPWNPDSVLLDMEIFAGEVSNEDRAASYTEAARDAARRGDQIAERYAETERDYQRAWRAGCDAREAMRDALELATEWKLVARAYRGATAAGERLVERACGRFNDAREAAHALLSDRPSGDLMTAWREGYGS